MDFFALGCQQGPFTALEFSLCDDQDSTKAYVSTTIPEKWVATVKNDQKKAVTFTAIDKCVIKDDEEQGRGRCDGMLTTDDLLYLVELKDQRADWLVHAKEQLESTINFLKANHDIDNYRYKKAFACNRRRKAFYVIDNEENKKFFKMFGFRLDIQAEIIIL